MDNDAARDVMTKNSSSDDPIRWLAGQLRWEQYLAHAHAVWVADHEGTPQRPPSHPGPAVDHRQQTLPPQLTTSRETVHTAPAADHVAGAQPNREKEPTGMLNEHAVAVIVADRSAPAERAATNRRSTPPDESVVGRSRRKWWRGLRLRSGPAKVV
jgi:hypothetical protein